MTVFYSLLALLGGALFPAQSAINAQLGRYVGGPLQATIVSFLVGLTCLLALYAVTQRAAFDPGVLRTIPPHLFVGGALGATFLGLSVFLVPRIGSGTLLCLLVSGQILAAMLIDYFGLFGLAARELSVARIAGAALVAIGAVLVRLY